MEPAIYRDLMFAIFCKLLLQSYTLPKRVRENEEGQLEGQMHAHSNKAYVICNLPQNEIQWTSKLLRTLCICVTLNKAMESSMDVDVNKLCPSILFKGLSTAHLHR